MKIVFDTNVILDVLTDREPFAEMSAKALSAVAREDVVGATTANTITDIYFLLRKREPSQGKRKDVLRELLKVIKILDTTGFVCTQALDSPITDFEDAVLAESARLWSADFIVTRNISDFTNSPVKALTPAEFVQTLTS